MRSALRAVPARVVLFAAIALDRVRGLWRRLVCAVRRRHDDPANFMRSPFTLPARRGFRPERLYCCRYCGAAAVLPGGTKRAGLAR